MFSTMQKRHKLTITQMHNFKTSIICMCNSHTNTHTHTQTYTPIKDEHYEWVQMHGHCDIFLSHHNCVEYVTLFDEKT